MRMCVPLEAGAGAPCRCEGERLSAGTAHPLLGQPLLALDKHEEITCTRRADVQTFARGSVMPRAVTGAAACMRTEEGGGAQGLLAPVP